MPIDKRDYVKEGQDLGGDGVSLGGLEFTDDTGEMGSATANVNPGPPSVNIPLSPGPGPGRKTGTVTAEEMGNPTNVTSVEFIAPHITKAIHASQPGAYITQASATHAASVLALTGTEQPPVAFTGPVHYRDERQPPADQVEIEFITGPNTNVVQTRPLVNGVLEDTLPPPGLFNVLMFLVVAPVMGVTTVNPGQFFTTFDASTTAEGTVVHGNQAPPPLESSINA